jgi:hypothetical protein
MLNKLFKYLLRDGNVLLRSRFVCHFCQNSNSPPLHLIWNHLLVYVLSYLITCLVPQSVALSVVVVDEY